MKVSGPEASAPTPFTVAPLGRSVVKSYLPAFEPLATNDAQTANRDEAGEPDEPTADEFDLPISSRRETDTAGEKETGDEQTTEASTP